MRAAEGGARVDESGRAPGRGAYLCRSLACWEEALTRGALDRALRTASSDEARSRLQVYVRGLETASAPAGAEAAAGEGGPQ